MNVSRRTLADAARRCHLCHLSSVGARGIGPVDAQKKRYTPTNNAAPVVADVADGGVAAVAYVRQYVFLEMRRDDRSFTALRRVTRHAAAYHAVQSRPTPRHRHLR